MQTIQEVIDRLNIIVSDEISAQSALGYFAALYRRMTMAVRDGIASGAFEDGKRMEQLDMIFAQRYLDAYDSWKKNSPLSSSWKVSFTAAAKNKLIVLQHLLLGINAHINLDLGIAAATICPGDRIHSLKNDFVKINSVIKGLMEVTEDELSKIWWPLRWFDIILHRADENIANVGILLSRGGAWEFAVELAYCNESERENHIHFRDQIIGAIGTDILNPGIWATIILAIIKKGERGTVAEKISLL
ncbi:MAG TPA: DUF5995 family protein [Chitinophagales bacterium]|nr:DUF5995 family protein [Chitinophagales bacterium]